ncbi:peptidylprolyl isomerase [Ramlibacter sp. AW1]|uniref:peptidylprolyl isomerase n=1 Tax=Ramlibacter aurantiacus TaxID=2801330 RepID=A0A937D406_9BURK|nr:peptidylprolyl isomerase [Ramlibacter aurantiacus]MBL0421235.1 peptidylprolyl isomerase [Ramlibacter aurantiacus]
MQIGKDTVVTMLCRISDEKGQLIQDGKQPMAYLHGGYDNTFPKIEQALDGRQVGDQVSLVLAAADAFGERDEALVRTLPKREFPPGVKVGGQLQLPGPDGLPRPYTVAKIKGDTVHLDGNHPLAGHTLKLAIKVAGLRPASAEELAHRHVHGEGGHHH